jgi:hypothetical protein
MQSILSTYLVRNISKLSEKIIATIFMCGLSSDNLNDTDNIIITKLCALFCY